MGTATCRNGPMAHERSNPSKTPARSSANPPHQPAEAQSAIVELHCCVANIWGSFHQTPCATTIHRSRDYASPSRAAAPSCCSPRSPRRPPGCAPPPPSWPPPGWPRCPWPAAIRTRDLRWKWSTNGRYSLSFFTHFGLLQGWKIHGKILSHRSFCCEKPQIFYGMVLFSEGMPWI